MSKNLRKSIRNTVPPGNSDPPSGVGDVDMENVKGGKTLRERNGVIAAAVTPRRKSERVQNSLPALYRDDDSSDPFSPSPAKAKKATPAKRAIQIKSTKETASPSVKLKKPKQTNNKDDDADAAVEDKKTPSGTKQKKSIKAEQTEQEKETERRRSTRAPIPVNRLANQIGQNRTGTPKIDEETPAPVTTSGSVTTIKLSRGRPKKRQESGNASAAEVSLSKTPKKVLAEEATTDNKVETPRSSRRNPARNLDQKDTITPVKSFAAVASSVLNPEPSSSSKVLVQGKKLEWKFNVYGIPKCPLPCRETQFEEIWKFLFENVTEKNSGCMYVSGVPGTGKTVIVQAVIDTMKKLNDKEKNLNFQVFCILYKNLSILLKKRDFILI